MRRFKKVFGFLLILSILVLGKWGINYVKAVSCGDSCSNTNECQAVADECSNQITRLQGQAKTLSNQIAQFNAQISLMTIKIKQTEDKITLLGGRIDQLEISLEALSKAFTSRAVETYKMSRSATGIYLLLSSDDLNQAVSRFHYLQVVQEEDRNLLQKLQTAQTDYKGQKKDQEDLQAELQTEKANLNKQKIAKANLLTATKNDEARYQQLLSQAIAQRNAFSSYISSQGGASILSNQTVCNDWGCYYNQRDSQWGNSALGTSALSVAQYGCLVTSSAMIAKHYGKNLTPQDIASESSAFFSPDSQTALLIYPSISVKGVTIQRTSLGRATSNIDSELSEGRPVIVGLFSGPGHFIVIKSGANGNYIMYDPFLENGGNGGQGVSFSSKYQLSDITDVERVNVH